jgi:hypothetical protein
MHLAPHTTGQARNDEIAESTTLALRIGNVDITGFFGLVILPTSWRYIRIYSKSYHPNIFYGLIKENRFRLEINAEGSVTQGPDLINKIMS